MEADQWGFLYLGASPYYQGAMSYFFQKILEDKKRDSVTRAIEKFISTHPIPEERLLKNKERIKKAKLEGASEFNLFHKRYEVMKKRL
jgi:predicted Zn-dependent protease